MSFCVVVKIKSNVTYLAADKLPTYLWSEDEELLTEMMSSDELKLSTNTFCIVPELQLSLGHALQNSTECHIKEEITHDAELDQYITTDVKIEPKEDYDAQIDENNQCSHLEDPLDFIKSEPGNFEIDIKIEPKEENDAQVDEYNQCSHLEDPLDLIKSEPDNVETDDVDIKLEIEDTILEEKDPNGAGSGLQLADNIYPKAVHIVLQRTDVKDSTTGARVTNKNIIEALKDTVDASTNKRNIKVEKNEEAEDITIKEPKKTRVRKPVTTSKILETCEKLDIKLNKCEIGVTSIVNNVCEEKSTNNRSIEHNVNSVSISKKEQFSCDTCKKCFKYESHFKSHIRTHTGEKPYSCNLCKKCFTQKGSLMHHIRTHAGEKPYQCNFCKKCFALKSVLKKHIRQHTGERPYECQVCKKSFTEKCNLINHIRIHTGEKPYECHICNKCFSHKNNLKNHIRTHTCEKPYECNLCKKCFSNKSHLNRHILTHTGKKT